jgi:hypothetical protein
MVPSGAGRGPTLATRGDGVDLRNGSIVLASAWETLPMTETRVPFAPQ